MFSAFQLHGSQKANILPFFFLPPFFPQELTRYTMEFDRAAAAAAEEDEGCRMVAYELEAAEALAGLARFSTARGSASTFVELMLQQAVVTSQDQPVAAEPTIVSGFQKAEKIEHIPTQLCSTSHSSNPPMKFRRKLTQTEKEERKIRRIMANRESARQTIRRRQAMHLELTRKAEEVLEENTNLKKQKELMIMEYNTLKGRNDCLKAQLAGVKKAAAGETEEDHNPDEAERCRSATATTQVFLHNLPSLVPSFWPSIIPPSDAFHFQCASHPHNISASQFLMPLGDIPCLHLGNPRPEGPLFVVPVPWLLPLLTHSSSGGTNTHHCGKVSGCLSDDGSSNHMPSSRNSRAEAYSQMETVCADSDGRAGRLRQPPSTIFVPGLFSPVRGRETAETPRGCQVDDGADLRLVSTKRHKHESIVCPPRKAEEVFVATEARRRRKELMKMKNIHCK